MRTLPPKSVIFPNPTVGQEVRIDPLVTDDGVMYGYKVDAYSVTGDDVKPYGFGETSFSKDEFADAMDYAQQLWAVRARTAHLIQKGA